MNRPLTAGEDFITGRLKVLLKKWKPDLVWIDPLLAYLGGDVNQQRDVTLFLREWLQPVLKGSNAGLIVVHHPPKPSGQEKKDWKVSDFAYSGAGSAELANFSRAVIYLEPQKRHGLFSLILGKRGSRVDTWVEEDGETRTYVRTIAHGKTGIFWRDADDIELATAYAERGVSKEDLLALVPIEKPIAKDALISKAKSAKDIGRDRAKGFISELIEDGCLHEWLVKRPRTNPAKLLARTPQSDQAHFKTQLRPD